VSGVTGGGFIFNKIIIISHNYENFVLKILTNGFVNGFNSFNLVGDSIRLNLLLFMDPFFSAFSFFL
jgi:hypothetical protein